VTGVRNREKVREAQPETNLEKRREEDEEERKRRESERTIKGGNQTEKEL